jgi:Domain of unknown function (DUF3425)
MNESAAIGEPNQGPCTSLAVSRPERALPDGDLLQPTCQPLPSIALDEVWRSSENARFRPSETTGQFKVQGLWSTISGSISSPNSLGLSTPTPSLSTDHDILSGLLQEDDRLDETIRRNITSGALTVQDVLQAGLHALSMSAVSQGAPSGPMVPSPPDVSPTKGPILRTDKILILENRKQVHSHSLPDPLANYIRIKQLSAVTAIRCNAEILGITFEQLCNEDTVSPLHDISATEGTENAVCAARFQQVSWDLRPTAAQIRHRHHPWIDTLPSPTLRQRLIECISSDPPVVDEDDFCQDLENDGLICWGSTVGKTDLPSGSGAPWDVRSWEAQPWFLRKWWFVVGGSNGELFQASKWWNEMRGDCLRYPWQ